ncbi:MAG: FecR family protein [Treponema sp.]|jgi:hypothetical protein|nr:FecR family protein [Treponema sp.]
MRKRKNTRFRAADLFILVFCFAGAFASAFAFWLEYNRTLVKLNEAPVGTIVFKNRTAHRKIEDRVAWDRLKQESPVYNGDTIRTAEESQAIITYRDEVTSVSLSENTLIQIFYDDELGARIDFTQGNLDVSSGSGVVLISNGASSVEMRGGSRAGLSQGGDGFGLSVFEGRADLDGSEVESGGVLFFHNDGTPDEEPLVAVTSPGTFSRVYGGPGEKAPVDFSWNTSNFTGETRVIVEVAEDRKFSRVVETRDVRGVSSVSVPLEAGSFWWRVYPAGAGGVSAVYPYGAVEVLSRNPAAIISPLSGREFSLSGGVPFSWTPVEGARGYLLEISAGEDISNPVVSRQVQGTSVVQNGLESGRWYWRVTPVLSDFPGAGPSSAVSSRVGGFTVGTGGAPSVPRLNSPFQNGIVGMENPRLLWRYDAGVSFWTVELADNSLMSDPVVKENTNVNYYVLPSSVLESGQTYYWRVTANGEGAASSSEVRSFAAAENAWEQRPVYPPDNYSLAAGELGGLEFTYRSGVPGQNYFQVSSGSDFSVLAVNEPADAYGSMFISGLESGTWYWRVYTGTADGPAASPPRRLNLVAGDRTPDVSVPAQLDRGDPLSVSWNAPGFDSYRFALYRGEDALPLEERTVADTFVTVPTASLEPGEYTVAVRGFNPESVRSARIAGAAAEERFVILAPPPVERMEPVITLARAEAPPPPPPPPPPPEPEPPLPPPPPPEPEPEPPPPEPEPEPEPPPPPPPEPEPPPPEPEPLPPEPEPEPPPPPEPEPEPLPPPPPPPPPEPPARDLTRTAPNGTVSGNFPPEGYVLSAVQLAGVRSVNFVWEGRAREYRFALYSADGGLIVPPTNVGSPSYLLENPGRLSPGDYIWQVFESGSRGRWDEYPSTANRFTVIEGTLPLKTIPANDPGVLYGRP